jgi:hypothetical protein
VDANTTTAILLGALVLLVGISSGIALWDRRTPNRPPLTPAAALALLQAQEAGAAALTADRDRWRALAWAYRAWGQETIGLMSSINNNQGILPGVLDRRPRWPDEPPKEVAP